jgi:predicted proteasome-type protease
VTCCLALRLDEGLIFLADTRTNAGLDNVDTYHTRGPRFLFNHSDSSGCLPS